MMQHCLNMAEMTVGVAESAQILDTLICLLSAFPQNSNLFPLPYMKTRFLLPSGQTSSLCMVTLISPSVRQWLFLEYTHTLKIMVGEAKCLCVWPHSSQTRQEAAKNSAAEEETASAPFWGKI